MDAATTLALTSSASHNARANQIRKFVGKPPPRGAMLKLVTVDEPPAQLGEWEPAQADGGAGSLSLEISALLEDHTQTIERHTEALLSWVDPSGRTVTSKRLRARYRAPDDDDGNTPEDEALGIDGSSRGQVIQLQRHMEVQTRSTHVFMQGLMQTALALNTQMQQQLQDAWDQIHRLQSRELERAEEIAEELQTAPAPTSGIDPADVDPAGVAKLEFVRMMEGAFSKYGPQAMQIAQLWLAQKMTGPGVGIQLHGQLAPPGTAPAAPAAPAAQTPAVAPTPAPAAPQAPPSVAAAAVPAVAPRAQRAGATKARTPATKARGRR